jgi:monofunctional biosynthetic peptidoglycan transglycosylase
MLLILALALVVIPPGSAEGQEVRRTVLEFIPEAVADWYVVNDGVMGGVSSSQMRPMAGDIAVFEGVLSLENNGGFASVRTEIQERALAGASALVLRVRGDGKRYQLRLRMDRSWDGVAYGASFETKADQWTTVEVPLDRFRPTFRGFVPRNARPLDPAQVRQIGLMLTDKQEGPFRLEIAGLDAAIGSSGGPASRQRHTPVGETTPHRP